MNPRNAYDWLLKRGRETAYLDSVRSLLVWDQRTQIPRKGHPHRTAQLAVMARLVHNRMTDPQIGERLPIVEGSELVEDPLSAEAVNIRDWRWAYDRATKVPEELAVELAQASAEGETAWEEARPRNNWLAFRPYLHRIVALSREKAEALGYAQEPYDALLDEYEPGETAGNLGSVFVQLRKALVRLLDRIRGSSNVPDTSILQRRYPHRSQDAFARLVAEKLGYDFGAGRLDPTAHPFTVGMGPGDVRMTVRFNRGFFNEAFFGVMHEAGHALYDQGLPAEHWGSRYRPRDLVHAVTGEDLNSDCLTSYLEEKYGVLYGG